MGTTTYYAIPYPAGSDPPAGAPQMQSLAERVDAVVKSNADADTALAVRVSTVENQTKTGRVASTTSQSATTGITSDIDVVTVTFTAVAGRRYKVSVTINALLVTSAGTMFGKITDAANVALQVGQYGLPVNAYYSINLWVEVPPGAAGSRTYKGRVSCSGGSVSLAGGINQPHAILVEDIGT